MGYIHGQELPNVTNIIGKHNTIFLREEILEFFMVPMVKTP